MEKNRNLENLQELYHKPLIQLVAEALQTHTQQHRLGEIQISSLLSIKTGGCPEDCAYCPQSAKFSTGLKAERLMSLPEVVNAAEEAKSKGASRFCMGAAWREVRNNRDFERVLEMVKEVRKRDLEVCCTLGMVTEEQARKLADAGLYAYNHNIDTSEEKYGDIIHTRTYQDRLNTLEHVRKAGLSVCSGGIIGMGESVTDRLNMLLTLVQLPSPPDSVPINLLVPVEGTPLQNAVEVPFEDLLRMIAVTRIVFPKAMVRLSAGRLSLSVSQQGLCFLAGANSIFAGDKLLTTPNPAFSTDEALFKTWGLFPKEAALVNS